MVVVYSCSKFSFALDILMVIAMVACTWCLFHSQHFVCTISFSPDTNHTKTHLVREQTGTAFK